MARAGLCSRRDAEEWILEGRVSVNGRRIDSPALDVTPKDRITVDGEPLPARERTRLWLYHKPAGLVTTADDPEGRPTVFDNLPPDLPRVISVGRLDINTEGLLLLTNDGGLARVLAHPSTGWLRRYRVRVHGRVDQAMLDTLREGVTIDGVDYEPINATLDRTQGTNAWLTMDLREGKNREVKVVLEHLGLSVTRLIRVSFGPFQLGDIIEGMAEEVRQRMLRDQLGDRLTAEAGATFDLPATEPARPAGAKSAPADDDADWSLPSDTGGFQRSELRPPRRDQGEERRPPRGDDRGAKGPGGAKPRVSRPEPAGAEKAPTPSSRAAERGHNPNVYRPESAGDKPFHKRRDKEGFGERRRAATFGDDASLKVETGDTADRKGRRVVVERIVSTEAAEAPPTRKPPPRRPGFKAPSGDARLRRRPGPDSTR
jgi:23S rRNA pseudouridine2605 synthase